MYIYTCKYMKNIAGTNTIYWVHEIIIKTVYLYRYIYIYVYIHV